LKASGGVGAITYPLPGKGGFCPNLGCGAPVDCDSSASDGFTALRTLKFPSFFPFLFYA